MTGYDSKRAAAADKLQEPVCDKDPQGCWNVRCQLGKQCKNLAQPAQEPVAHLWECLGRWSAYLVTNGTQADCAPPSWLVDAIQNATTPPSRPWVRLTDEEIITMSRYDLEYAALIGEVQRKLKDKNT